MKPSSPSSTDEKILTQAAHWCMRLHDESCTAEERLNFQQWLQSNPRHAFEYAKMLEVWDLSDELPKSQGTAKKLLTDPSASKEGAGKT